MPKKTKYRKMQRGRMSGYETRGNRISYGEFGIVALEPAWIKSNQIEATRIAVTRYMNRIGNVWIKIFPQKSYTKKPLETRMGKGKGNLEGWVAVVKPGRVLFEVSGVPEEVAREALRRGAHKLPIKTKFYSKSELDAVVDARLAGNKNLKDEAKVEPVKQASEPEVKGGDEK